jgi:putative addiction module component (TIGR02574 family)
MISLENLHMTAAQKIASEALSLSPNERADIAQLLLQSLEASENHEDKWITEVERRAQEMEQGKVKPVSWEEIKSFAKSK